RSRAWPPEPTVASTMVCPDSGARNFSTSAGSTGIWRGSGHGAGPFMGPFRQARRDAGTGSSRFSSSGHALVIAGGLPVGRPPGKSRRGCRPTLTDSGNVQPWYLRPPGTCSCPTTYDKPLVGVSDSIDLFLKRALRDGIKAGGVLRQVLLPALG